MTKQEKALWHAVKQLQQRLGFAAGGVFPRVHAESHAPGGTDPIDISTLGFLGTIGARLYAAGDLVTIECPFAGDIVASRMFGFDADGLAMSGSAVGAWWKDTYVNHQPTAADSIVAAAPPTLSAAAKSQDTTLPGWTVSISEGDILVASLATIGAFDSVQMQLTIERSS